MNGLLVALLLLALSQPAAGPADFSEAKRLADADEASVTGPTHDALLTAQGALLDAGVEACNLPALRTDKSPFVIVLQLDAGGQVTQTWRQGNSPLAICLQRFVRGKLLISPPRTPFYAALEISFTQ